MTIFNKYSLYYNLLNKDKNYPAEVDYVIELIRENSTGAKNILDLGCGTGKHDYLFAKNGYNITGVDLSAEMIEVAKSGLSNVSAEHAPRFQQGDIRKLQIGKVFDVVVSLFHVISYQTTNEDLIAAFKGVSRHLKDDGIFIFDCWYGPAVLTDRPYLRTRIFEDEDYSIERISTPEMHPNTNCVEVNFDISIVNKKINESFKINEVHQLRYLFLPEIELLLGACGLELVKSETWLTREPLSFSSWNALFICKKKVAG